MLTNSPTLVKGFFMSRKKKEDKEREAGELLLDAIFSEPWPNKVKKTLKASIMGYDTDTSDYQRLLQGMAKQLISVSDAAKLRNISRISMYDLIERGRLHTIELGG